jgi:hypothetical protein
MNHDIQSTSYITSNDAVQLPSLDYQLHIRRTSEALVAALVVSSKSPTTPSCANPPT